MLRTRRNLLSSAAAAALLFGLILIAISSSSSRQQEEQQPPSPVVALDEDAVRAFNDYASAVLNGGMANVISPPPPPAPDLTAHDIAQLFNLPSSHASALSVWPFLRQLALRPDLFIQAKDAIAEAVPVWRQLLEDEQELRQEKRSSSQRCQFSTRSSVNESSSKALLIPCGLNVDSSITLIGTPSGSFSINLTAAQGSNILSYELLLARNASSMIQSSGASRDRCPSRSSSSKKVDGLSTCAHKGQPAHPFPLVIGLPFVSTIWLGWHGFHMSINGKHISSFKYRQNHEPWLVSSVNVTGPVEVTSLMATGLPVSEPRDALPSYLRAPAASSTPVLFIGVFSTANNFARRMAIRRTWMQYDAVRSGSVIIRFFVGLDKSPEVNREIWAEARDYNDTQLLPFVDHYEVITLKTLAICIYAVKVVKAGFIMKADDDTFVRVDEVLSLLRKQSPKQGFLLGMVEYSASPNRDEGEKWYISEQEWPYAYYPPWAHGPGYVISREVGKYVVQSYQKSRLKLFKLEDVAMGIWISEYTHAENKRVEYVHNDRFFHLECSAGYVIAHYQKPTDMVCLWQHLKRGRGPVCCQATP